MTSVTCPACGTPKTRVVARQSLGDRVFGWATVYPFRCQLCAHRFRAFVGRSADCPRRNFDRIPVEFPVWFRPLHASPLNMGCEGVIQDLSIRGCRIRSDRPVPPGTKLELEFQHSNVSFPITVDEAVVRSMAAGTFGLRFTQLHREDQRRIRTILDVWLPEPASGPRAST